MTSPPRPAKPKKPTWVIDKERARRAAAAETVWLFGLHAVRDALMADRKAGHWADPTVDDDRHDENSLFGHGESSEDGETEE